MRPFLLDGDMISLDSLEDAKTKKICQDLTSTPPPPKIITKHTPDWGLVWSRLGSPVLSSEGRDTLFTLLLYMIFNPTRIACSR